MPSISIVEELKLRRWAREHFVPQAYRKSGWHAVVLDEMRCRDVEMAAAEAVQPASLFVPLEPTLPAGYRRDAAERLRGPHLATRMDYVRSGEPTELYLG